MRVADGDFVARKGGEFPVGPALRVRLAVPGTCAQAPRTAAGAGHPITQADPQTQKQTQKLTHPTAPLK